MASASLSRLPCSPDRTRAPTSRDSSPAAPSCGQWAPLSLSPGLGKAAKMTFCDKMKSARLINILSLNLNSGKCLSLQIYIFWLEIILCTLKRNFSMTNDVFSRSFINSIVSCGYIKGFSFKSKTKVVQSLAAKTWSLQFVTSRILELGRWFSG